MSLTLFLLLKKIWNLCSLTIQQSLCVFLLRSAYCSSFPPIHWPPCPFHFACCCIPVLLSFTKVLDIPGNLSSVFAVWKKCSEENENKTELDWDSIQPRILSLTREREHVQHLGRFLLQSPNHLQRGSFLSWKWFQHPALHCSLPLVCPMLAVGLCHMWGVPCQDMCTPHEKQTLQLCPEPKSYQLWCFFHKALFTLGREEWGDFPWATFLFKFFFFFFKGNFNEKFYFWNWDGMRCSEVVSSILLFLPPCSSLSQDFSYSCISLATPVCFSWGLLWSFSKYLHNTQKSSKPEHMGITFPAEQIS